jgi:hypothetical protein
MEWQPELRVSEVGGRCRLVLGGVIHGDGDSLQEAGDALVARAAHVGLGLRSERATLLTLPANRELLDLLYRIGDPAARGDDVRDVVLGTERRAA